MIFPKKLKSTLTPEQELQLDWGIVMFQASMYLSVRRFAPVTLNWKPEPRIRLLPLVWFTVLCQRNFHPVTFPGTVAFGGGFDEFVKRLA